MSNLLQTYIKKKKKKKKIKNTKYKKKVYLQSILCTQFYVYVLPLLLYIVLYSTVNINPFPCTNVIISNKDREEKAQIPSWERNLPKLTISALFL